MFNRRQNNNQGAAAEYTSVPAGAGAGTGVGGTANYPAGAVDQNVGYGNQAGKDVNMRSGYGPGYDTTGNVQNGGYGGPGYVQQQTNTPVSYGPNGQPIDARRRHNNRFANWCAGAFVACWACTWPCHGPCCCGL